LQRRLALWRRRFLGARPSIRHRLALAFGTQLVLMGLIGGVALREIMSVTEVTHEMNDVALPRLLALNELESALRTHEILAEQRLQATDFRQIAEINRAIREAAELFENGMTALYRIDLDASQRALLWQLQRDWETYVTSLQYVMHLISRGDVKLAKSAFEDETERLSAQASRSLARLISLTHDDVEMISDTAEAEHRNGILLTVGALVSGLLAALVSMIWVRRHVSKPLLGISIAMRRLTLGKDTAQLPDLPKRRDEIGALACAATAFRDSVLEIRTLAADLELQRALLATTVRNMPLGLCMFDTSQRLVVSNEAFRGVFDLEEDTLFHGAEQNDVLGRVAHAINPDEDHSEVLKAQIDEIVSSRLPETVVCRLANGNSVSFIIQPMPDGWMIIAEDVTERVSAEQNIRRIARRDPLTGLPNRRAFGEELDMAISEATHDRPSAVLFIDLDRFKHVNDTLGHPVGDALLRVVAERLKWAVREGDTVARLGGDEFAIIQRGCSQPESAQGLGERIVELLSSPFEIDGNTVQIGGSVGVALVPGHGETADEVLKNVDLALYAVKSSGKGRCVFFDPVMNERQQALHKLEQDLRQALKTDAFLMHFQPLFDLDTRRVCGAEALLRWHHPTRGMVPPSDFVPMAEELGLIVPLGGRALHLACTAAAMWPEDIKVAINLSPLQFRSHDLLADIHAALAGSGLDPRRLELEITECVLLDDSAKTLEILHALRALGVRIALDDFGTGYSSLRYLRAFPFDKVKIDASFVRELHQDESAAALVRAICALCASLRICVTAEGIETAQQLATVAAEGCAEAQGYYLGRPQTGADFLALIGTGPALDAGVA